MRTHLFRRLNCFFVLLLCLGIWQGLPAQIQAAGGPDAQVALIRQSSSAIRISTNLVTVPVSVTDSVGSHVADLDIMDFQLTEDGRTEKILTMIQAGKSPLQLTLIFDLSESVQSDFEFERTAACRFLEKVWKPGDSVSIVSIGKKPCLHLEGSASLEKALQILSHLEPTENATAFFDAITMSADLLSQSTAPNTRQVGVVFSDGEDNISDRGFMEALDAMRHSNTVVYSINPSGASIRLNEISHQGQQWLVSLTGKTGGAAFVLDKNLDLDGVYERIAMELRSQYLLSYYSSNPYADGSFRNILVTIPLQPGLQVRARQGYYAVLAPPTPRK